MRLVVIFRDSKKMMDHRAQYEGQHLAYLDQHHKEIIIGGGLRNKPNDKFVGGLWVLEVESFDRAEQLVHNDPYYSPGLREYEILVWGKAGNREAVL